MLANISELNDLGSIYLYNINFILFTEECTEIKGNTIKNIPTVIFLKKKLCKK
jgi:hypothetical protein